MRSEFSNLKFLQGVLETDNSPIPKPLMKHPSVNIADSYFIVSIERSFYLALRSVFNRTFFMLQSTLLSQYLFIFNACVIFPRVCSFSEADDKVHCNINQRLMPIIWTSCQSMEGYTNVLFIWFKSIAVKQPTFIFQKTVFYNRSKPPGAAAVLWMSSTKWITISNANSFLPKSVQSRESQTRFHCSTCTNLSYLRVFSGKTHVASLGVSSRQRRSFLTVLKQ